MGKEKAKGARIFLIGGHDRFHIQLMKHLHTTIFLAERKYHVYGSGMVFRHLYDISEPTGGIIPKIGIDNEFRIHESVLKHWANHVLYLGNPYKLESVRKLFNTAEETGIPITNDPVGLVRKTLYFRNLKQDPLERKLSDIESNPTRRVLLLGRYYSLTETLECANRLDAEEIAVKLINAGFYVYSHPHASKKWQFQNGISRYYLNSMLKSFIDYWATDIVIIGKDLQPGAIHKVEYAKKIGIPVYPSYRVLLKENPAIDNDLTMMLKTRGEYRKMRGYPYMEEKIQHLPYLQLPHIEAKNVKGNHDNGHPTKGRIITQP